MTMTTWFLTASLSYFAVVAGQVLLPSDLRICVQLPLCLVKPCPDGETFGFGQPIDLGTGGEVFSIFAGFPFELELRGDGLSGEDHVVLVDASQPCGSPAESKSLQVYANWTAGDDTDTDNISDESNASATSDVSVVIWRMSPVPRGGPFRLCWCSGRSSCLQDSSFQVEML